MTKEKTPCKNCINGLIWVTREQIENGITTKKMKPTLCNCCNGDYRDCERCTREEKLNLSK